MCQFTVGGAYLLLRGWEAALHAADGGSKHCCSPHHHLTPSQRILATVTLLSHYLRQQSTQTSFLDNFIYKPDGRHMGNSIHITAH